MNEPMRIGYLTTLYHTSFILRGLARGIEFERSHEFEIRPSWKLFPNGPAMMEAFERDEIDLGYVGLPPAMMAIGRGVKIKCVAGGHVEGTVLIGGRDLVAGKTAKEALAQFRGMTIGAPRRGSIHDVILRKLISDCGLSDDISIRNYDWADFILDAMMDGEVEGGCGTPPLAVLAARQLGAKMVLSPSKVWPYNPSYGIVASERFIQNSSLALEDFLRRHEDACNLIREQPDAAARLVHIVAEIIEEDFAREVFRVSPKYCAGLPDEYINSAMAFVPALREMGYLDIDRDLTREDVFCMRLIEKVHPGRHHYEARS
jgi:NitT/TauT family transport system substrate-binding protein